MSIRFTGFLKCVDMDVSFYAMQENNEPSRSVFTIQVKKGEDNNTEVWKKYGNSWEIDSLNVPEWLTKIKVSLANLIEKRLSEIGR